jgi:hypothetical protein
MGNYPERCLVKDRVGPGGAQSASGIGITGSVQAVVQGRASSACEAHLAKRRAIDKSTAYGRAYKMVLTLTFTKHALKETPRSTG